MEVGEMVLPLDFSVNFNNNNNNNNDSSINKGGSVPNCNKKHYSRGCSSPGMQMVANNSLLLSTLTGNSSAFKVVRPKDRTEDLNNNNNSPNG